MDAEGNVRVFSLSVLALETIRRMLPAETWSMVVGGSSVTATCTHPLHGMEILRQLPVYDGDVNKSEMEVTVNGDLFSFSLNPPVAVRWGIYTSP